MRHRSVQPKRNHALPDRIHQARPPTHSFHFAVLRPITGWAFIDSRGVVHELRLDYVMRPAANREQVVIVTQSVYYTDLGSTTVERPVWYVRAVNQTMPVTRTTATATTTD